MNNLQQVETNIVFIDVNTKMNKEEFVEFIQKYVSTGGVLYGPNERPIGGYILGYNNETNKLKIELETYFQRACEYFSKDPEEAKKDIQDNYEIIITENKSSFIYKEKIVKIIEKENKSS